MLILTLFRSLLLSRTALALENIALRQQVAVLKRSVARPRLCKFDRLFWVLLRRLWSGWRDVLHVVQPATVVAWHRAGWRLVWRWKSRGKPGRPQIPVEVRELIRRLSRENRLWGSKRIQDELVKLGIRVAKSTIEKYMTRHTGPPSGTWRAFLQNHAGEILACDFFKIPTASFKVITGFVVMELGRRRILAIDATMRPTALWASGVLRRAAEAGGGAGKFLIRDRDGIYGDEFRDACRSLGLRPMVTQYKSPLQNAHVERLIGTLRRECLDHVIVFGEGHARRILGEFAVYYNEDRCHRSLGGQPPVPLLGQRISTARIEARPYLGGLHHGYCRAG